MVRTLSQLILLAFVGSAAAFLHQPFTVCRGSAFKLNAKKSSGEPVHTYSIGTFVEFEEKKRTHLGKVDDVQYKSSGQARYTVLDAEGHKYQIPSKAVHYSIPCPNSPGQATKLFDEFLIAGQASQQLIEKKLDISPDLLEMAWEETLEEDGEHVLTADSLVELVHSHAASAIEKYMAWRLLGTEMAHIFFRDIKDHGTVVGFKAKARSAVEAAKIHFCQTHQDDNEICFV
mmetsp:Transcript_53420/g.79391  ORF Transcript_53420/g.79391 Transcript_53420/m.79391 type:complete len:231 (+) Transcript_53420:117-809(+)|eukprot:CAMPEP_0195519148 /NCGR_PEP_ID=MMETSP0794_2-20130614/14475_1 /TAXON_ID=515487 /ORGANISM="Stephanopyxis turris, Strain CCMP 815" /LENGTH=230 /DNA_ID=CAMNT_0040648259 /DNA_START=111 /DNA_END=803 /DNA_ORIENTATION=-